MLHIYDCTPLSQAGNKVTFQPRRRHLMSTSELLKGGILRLENFPGKSLVLFLKSLVQSETSSFFVKQQQPEGPSFLTFITAVAHASRIMCKPIMYVHIICMKAFTPFMCTHKTL